MWCCATRHATTEIFHPYHCGGKITASDAGSAACSRAKQPLQAPSLVQHFLTFTIVQHFLMFTQSTRRASGKPSP